MGSTVMWLQMQGQSLSSPRHFSQYIHEENITQISNVFHIYKLSHQWNTFDKFPLVDPRAAQAFTVVIHYAEGKAHSQQYYVIPQPACGELAICHEELTNKTLGSSTSAHPIWIPGQKGTNQILTMGHCHNLSNRIDRLGRGKDPTQWWRQEPEAWYTKPCGTSIV